MTTDFLMRTRLALTLALTATLAACGDGTTNPPPGSPAYARGELGNGLFVFSCGNGPACLPYSGEAKNFPDLIATGSTFELRFVENDEQGTTRSTSRSYDGITVDGVMPYVGRGGEGLAALKPGYGTIYAQDSKGSIIDYVTVHIVKPSALVVYEATDASEARPPRVDTIKLSVGQTRSFRVVGEVGRSASSGGTTVAGSLRVAWESSNGAIARVDGYSDDVVTLRGASVGTTTVSIDGAGLPDTTLDVEVTQ